MQCGKVKRVSIYFESNSENNILIDLDNKNICLSLAKEYSTKVITA